MTGSQRGRDANVLVKDHSRDEPAQAAEGSRMGGTSRALTAVIRSYQLARSGRPTGCRYLPTCSEYAIEAVERHGTLRGGWLAARRIGRCGPWGGHGIDPVPERSTP